MRRLSCLIAAGIGLSAFAIACQAVAGNWPQWRGPQGTGVSNETGLPVDWNSSRGIIWKTDLPEWGDSTPAIWGNSIFVTTQHGDDLLLLKLEKATGRILWTRTVGTGDFKRIPVNMKTGEQRKRQNFHPLQNQATPSPVTNGVVVVVHFGDGDLAAYDFEGKQLWHHNLEIENGRYTVWWGHANSPVIFGNSVISACMQDSLADIAKTPAESYLVAHDLQTGKQQWKTLRMTGAKAEECDAYTTPLVAEVDGKPQMIVMGGNQLDAYNPASGKQIWFLPGIVGGRTVGGATVADGLVFATQGKSGPLLAVKPGDQTGKLPHSDIAWKLDHGTPDSCTPVAWEDHLFTLQDAGRVRCIDIHTGHLLWTEHVKGQYKASPVAAEGRIYLLNTSGLCTVISASDKFEKLAENQIDDDTIASPALSDHRIYLRGHKAIYCLGKDF